MIQDSHEAKHPQEYELGRRLIRDRRLRKKYIRSILKKQKFECADPHKQCYTVILGKATSRCPFVAAKWKLPIDMAELDHIVPLSEGGTDHPSNLQVLCACCHAAKSHAERNKS
jgi:5-methylcytosine-specific restriction endonuclease McrA